MSHVESGRHRPTEDFARRADDALRAQGELLSLWRTYDVCRDRSNTRRAVAGEPATTRVPPAELVVEHEEALMRYDGERYRITIRRHLHNRHPDPVARYFIKIAVDELTDGPLTWEELGLTATCRDLEMTWTTNLDVAALKEIWLLFENDRGEFPLHPGERTWIEYSYTVDEDKWGSWFQRAIRLPTNQLSVRMLFPAELSPEVWGTEVLMVNSRRGDLAPIVCIPQGKWVEYTWGTQHPPLHARYRLEWSFSPIELDRYYLGLPL